MGRTVRYSVTATERWDKVSPFFLAYPDAMAQLLARFEPTEVDFEGLTVKGMLEAVGGRMPEELERRLNGCTVGDWCAVMLGVRKGLERFAKFMEETTPPVTVEQKRMAKGVLSGNIEESVLMTLKSCFSLHGLEDAQKLTVYEYMVARKEVYNEAVVNYNQSMAAAAVSARR